MRASNRINKIVVGEDDGWGIYYRAKALMDEGRPVIMLSIGDHDIKTSPRILDAMKASMDGGHLGYASVEGTWGLRSAIAERINRRYQQKAAPEQIVVTAGGQAALYAALTAALDPSESCIVLDPYYATYLQTVRAVAGVPIPVQCRADEDFQPDIEAIAAAIRPDTRAILINTPNNPSGAVYHRDRMEALAKLCIRHDLWLISDEVYDSHIWQGEFTTARDLPGMVDRVMLVNSMSKSHAMTGSRIGWVVTTAEVQHLLGDMLVATNYGLPGFVQDAAEFALREGDDTEAEVIARYRHRREVALQALGTGPGFELIAPEGGMFLMLDIRDTGMSGEDFALQLLEEELIGVMPGESFGDAAAGHIRVALTVPEDQLKDALARIAGFAARQVERKRKTG